MGTSFISTWTSLQLVICLNHSKMKLFSYSLQTITPSHNSPIPLQMQRGSFSQIMDSLSAYHTILQPLFQQKPTTLILLSHLLHELLLIPQQNKILVETPMRSKIIFNRLDLSAKRTNMRPIPRLNVRLMCLKSLKHKWSYS